MAFTLSEYKIVLFHCFSVHISFLKCNKYEIKFVSLYSTKVFRSCYKLNHNKYILNKIDCIRQQNKLTRCNILIL